jgi:hypothetical protein
MSKKQFDPIIDDVTLFYVGAALYLDLDSSRVDYNLACAGIELTADNIPEARKIIKQMYPDRYAAAREAARRLFGGGL